MNQSLNQAINNQSNSNTLPVVNLESIKRCKTFPVHLKSCLSGLSSGVVHGGWGDFGDWSECSVPCGGGIKERRRNCTNPPPASGGQCCAGDNMEAQSCNTEPCEGEEGRKRF